ncbi:MAG: RNA polymerase sigma factor [Candidatus Doudnabacteria bacterium]|nr:RNA polymerase sigma factor [Candidatus Doudnabacteria bacterium]
MESNESEIIAQCKAGDWQNFDTIYDQYLPKIYQYVFYRLRHKQIAEDVTSQIFLKAVQHLGSFKQGQAPFGAWLYRIARNAVIDSVRRQKPVSDLETAMGVSSPDNVMRQIDAKVSLQAAQKQMQKLPDLQREVLTLRVWDELSHREIANILEISEDSSKVALSRAIANLKQSMEIA